MADNYANLPTVIQGSTQTGFQTITFSGVVSVTDSTTVLLTTNLNRRYVHIINNDSVTAYIQYGSAAVQGRGIKIPVGGMLVLSSSELFLGVINGISSQTMNLDILEGA